MLLQRFHHVAYRCRDAQETVDFYTKVLGLKYDMAHSNVSRHGDGNWFMHIFFELADGSHLAFFDMPELDEQGWDPVTPRWVQHIAFQVDSMDVLLASKRRLEESGLEVEGPKKGKIIGSSIYFEDPSGHRLELTTRHTPPDLEALEKNAWEGLTAWNAKRADLISAARAKRSQVPA